MESSASEVDSLGVTARNNARQELLDAFQSIDIWLFPVPVESSGAMSDRIDFNTVSERFWSKLKEMRSTLVQQLSTPTLFAGEPMNGDQMSFVVPAVVKVLNEGQIVMLQVVSKFHSRSSVIHLVLLLYTCSALVVYTCSALVVHL